MLPSFPKVNVMSIIVGHFKTLTNSTSGKIYFWDIFLFYIVPAFTETIAIIYKVELDVNISTALMSALAIFSGLLFNLLLLAHGIIKGVSGNDQASVDKRDLLKQLYLNISYSILLTVVAILPVVVNFSIKVGWVSMITSWATYFLIANFLLTLLMVLKRINLLLETEFR